jgi:hypothetical protein
VAFRRVRTRHGLGDDDDHELDSDVDRLALDSPALAACYGGSVSRRAALGPDAGKAIIKIGADPNTPWVNLQRPRHSHHEGFDLHAGLPLPAHDRDGLEQLLRYAARPAIASKRLQLQPDGRVRIELKRRYYDGTTHLLFNLQPHDSD